MLLRYGTVLELVQKALGYSQVELSDRLNIPPSSLNSYISGARVPTLRSEIRHQLKRLILEVAENFKLQHPNISDFALHLLVSETNIRRILEIDQETFQYAAAKVLVHFLNKTELKPTWETSNPVDCLSILLEGKNDFYSKASIALYLAQKARKSGFSEKEEGIWGKAIIPIAFPDLSSMLQYSDNIILDPSFALDIFLSLPDMVSFKYDINDNYRSSLTVIVNEQVTDKPLLFKGNTLMMNI